MKKSLLLSVCLLGFPVVPPSTVAARAAETSAQRAGRAAIAAIYRRTDAAMVSKNLTDLTSYLAPDYQLVMCSGQKLSRAQSVAMMRQIVGGSASGAVLKYSKCTTRILSLTWRGKDAIVMAQATAVSTAQGGARMEQVSVARDYWTPTASGWKLRQSVETQSKIWINGKRFQ